MKIFIVHENPYNAGNPYIYTLMDCITQHHPDVEWGWGLAQFWDSSIFSYEIIHFQWPQAFMASDNRAHSMSDFSAHLSNLKKKGIRIVATCHDLEAHYNQCAEFSRAIEIVYEMADAIFHLGEYSKEIFESKYKNSNHYLLPHHIFDTVYKEFPSRKEGLKHLKLHENKTYILCLGMFRSDEERDLVINCAKKINNKKVYFLAPAFMNVIKRRYFKFLPTLSQLKQFYLRWRYKIICTGETWVPVKDEEIPYYYAAADIAFVHRLKILNSGNAILPMLFKKKIIGPDIGNVGCFLKKWGYPVFDPLKPELAYKILEQGLSSGFSINFSSKYEEQLKLYSTLTISEKLYSFYQNEIASKNFLNQCN